MDLQSIPLFKALTRHMAWLNQRQRVLAENIANANTPGYRPRDLKELSFREMVAGAGPIGLKATHRAHLKGPGGNGAPVARETRPSDVEPTPTGNTVVLEQELMKVAQTRLDHEVTASLYRKHVDMLRMVLARR